MQNVQEPRLDWTWTGLESLGMEMVSLFFVLVLVLEKWCVAHSFSFLS